MGHYAGLQYSSTGTFPYDSTSALAYLQLAVDEVSRLRTITELTTTGNALGDLVKGRASYSFAADLALPNLQKVIDVAVKVPTGTVAGTITGLASTQYTVYTGGFYVNVTTDLAGSAAYSLELPTGDYANLTAQRFAGYAGSSNAFSITQNLTTSGVNIIIPPGGTELFTLTAPAGAMFIALTFVDMRLNRYKYWQSSVAEGQPASWGVEGNSIVLLPAPDSRYGSGPLDTIGANRLRLIYSGSLTLSIVSLNDIPWPPDFIDLTCLRGAVLQLQAIDRTEKETDRLNRLTAQYEAARIKVLVDYKQKADREMGKMEPVTDYSDWYPA